MNCSEMSSFLIQKNTSNEVLFRATSNVTFLSEVSITKKRSHGYRNRETYAKKEEIYPWSVTENCFLFYMFRSI